MTVWSGIRTSNYISHVKEEDIQPNGVDLRVGDIWYLRKEDEREAIHGFGKGYSLLLSASKQYVARAINRVTIPQGACAIFLPRSSMWRKKGLIICHSLFDTGYSGHPEFFIKPTFDVEIKYGERIGQIVYMDADFTFEYNGQYQEAKVEAVR